MFCENEVLVTRLAAAESVNVFEINGLVVAVIHSSLLLGHPFCNEKVTL